MIDSGLLVARSSIAICVVNRNTRRELRQCLESLSRAAPENAPVIVFDNASTDGSAEMVASDFPDARLIRSEVNLGYGAAANRAAGACDADCILVSNSDIVFPAGSIAAIRDDFDAHPRTGMAGPRLLNTDGTLQPSCFPYPGSARWLWDNDASCKCLRWLPVFRNASLRAWPHDQDRIVPWVKGALLALRREAFEQAGGFDEAFFMYFEETDLAWRMSEKGWEIRFTPAAECVHSGGASTEKVRVEMAVQLVLSAMLFAERHYSRAHFLAFRLLWKAILRYRLVRDRLRIGFYSDPGRRDQLRQDIAAWTRALAS